MSTISKMSRKTSNSTTSTLFMSSIMSSTHNLFCKRSKDNQLEAIKVSELIEQLQRCDPDAEIWLPNVNERGIPGYCVLDHVMNMTFGEVVEDVMNNPGEIDHRLLHHKTNETPIIYLGSIAEFIKEGVEKPAENR